MPKQLASPAPTVEHVVSSAAPVEDSVRCVASTAPKVEQAEAASAIPVKAPQADPAIVDDDDDDGDKLDDGIQTNSPNTSLHASKLVKTSAFSSYAGVYAITTKINKKPWLIRQALLLLNDDRIFVSLGEIKRFIIIHDTTCYVYLEETSLKPLYVIDLQNYKCIVETNIDNPNCAIVSPDVNSCHENTITLTSLLLVNAKSGSAEFQFVFEDDTDVDSFLKNVNVCSK